MNSTQAQIDRLTVTITEQEAEVARLEAQVEELRVEFRPFEARYKQIVQAVIDRVEAVRSAIRDLEQAQARQQWDETISAEELWRKSNHSNAPQQDPIPPPEEDLPSASKPRNIDESLKVIYRRLARLYHPDLATDEQDRIRRNGLMAQINEAYANHDREALLALDKSAPEDDSQHGDDANHVQIPLDVLKLRRLQQQSADLSMRIADLKIEHHDLMYGSLMDLKIQDKFAQSRGRDLLQEMADEYEQEYWLLMKRLDALRNAI